MRTATLLLSLGLSLVACGAGEGGLKLDSSGLKTAGSGSLKAPELPKLGEASATSAADASASKSLAAIATLDILGTRISKSFHKDGVVHVVVLARDATGKPILDKNVFVDVHVKANLPFPIKAKVKVGEVRVPTSAQPFQLAVDVDSSGSMSMSDKSRARVPAAKHFIDVVEKDFAKSEFGVWDFDDQTRELQPFTADVEKAKAAVDKVKEGGGTAMHKSAMQALDALHGAKKPGYQQALLVLTDGQDNSSKPVTAQQVIDKAKADHIPIFALALGGALDIPGLSFVGDIQEYASETGGVFAYSKNADALAKAFDVMAIGATKGSTDVELNLSGGTYVPFSTLTIEVKVSSGGKDAHDSFDLIVPLGG
jgi:hypothetical protein